MWDKIKDTPYFLLFTVKNGYELYITDYISLWNICFTEKSFLSQLKESNDGLELESDNEFILKGLHLFKNINELSSKSIVTEGNGLSINFKIRHGCPFYFQCTLAKGPEELFFKIITQNLLKVINDLRTSQIELRNLLIKKDKEIEEYKSEGEEIVLKHLKTGPFNDEEHMKLHKVYEQCFGDADVASDLLEKSIQVSDNIDVHTGTTTSHNIKAEPNLVTSSHSMISQIKKEPAFTPTSTQELDIPYVPSVSCKQELIKTEAETKPENRRKRLKKLNF